MGFIPFAFFVSFSKGHSIRMKVQFDELTFGFFVAENMDVISLQACQCSETDFKMSFKQSV